MNKKLIIIAIAVVSIVVVGFFIFKGLKSYTKMASPEAEAQYSNAAGLLASVKYSSPQVRGREIFGGLVPYDKIWRTGANEATTIQFEKPIIFGDQQVAAGKYSLWTKPGILEWDVILNTETGQWGVYHDETKDFATVILPSQTLDQVQESFSISFEGDGNQFEMIIAWDKTSVRVPIHLSE